MKTADDSREKALKGNAAVVWHRGDFGCASRFGKSMTFFRMS
jgi:hypothetical protein